MSTETITLADALKPLSLAVLIEVVASIVEVDGVEMRAELLPALRRLVSDGFLLPA